MYTALVLVKNLERAPAQPTANAAFLEFKDFRIWNIPQFQGTNGEKLRQAREIFSDAQIDDWVLERSYRDPPPAPGAAPSGFGGIPQDIEDTLLLLRLFKVGDLSFAQVKVRDTNGRLYRQLPYRMISEIPTTLPYQFAQDECPEWDAFAYELKRAPAWFSSWFRVARRFFLYGGAKELNCYKEPQAGIENNEVDRILDYMVALEAALVPEKDFVGRRLRERAAVLVNQARSEAEEAKRLLKDFYQIRSTIAHGAPLSDDQRKTITHKHGRFESAVRKILVAALRTLPRDEEGRKRTLDAFWVPSDSDRSQKLLEGFGSIKSKLEKRRLLERLSVKNDS